MHLSNSMEIRNFLTTQYFLGQPGSMVGSQHFMVEAVLRVVGTPPASVPETIFSNASDAGSPIGWILSSTPQGTLSANGERLFGLNFAVFGSTTLNANVTFPLENVLGKTLHVQCLVVTFDPGEGVETFITMYVNGSIVGFDSGDDYTMVPSSAAPSVGYSPTFTSYGALQSASVLSVGYSDLENPQATDPFALSAAVASRFVETMKRAMVLANISTVLSANGHVSNVYDVATSNGSIGGGQPGVLTNVGALAPAGDLLKAGNGTSLITTAAYTEWGSPIVVPPAEG